MIGVMVLFGCWFWIVAWVVGEVFEAKRVEYGLGLVGLFFLTVAGRVYYKMRRGSENQQSGSGMEKGRIQQSEIEALKASKSD